MKFKMFDKMRLIRHRVNIFMSTRPWFINNHLYTSTTVPEDNAGNMDLPYLESLEKVLSLIGQFFVNFKFEFQSRLIQLAQHTDNTSMM